MLKKLSLIIVLLLTILNFPVCCLERDKTTGKIISIDVVTDDNYPPYIFRDFDGKLKGIIVEQWSLWSDVTGIKANIIGMDWGLAQEFIKKNKADIIETIFQTDERMKLFDFTDEYAKIEVPVFFHKNISGITDVKSLKGFTIGVKKGDACIEELEKEGITDFQVFNSYESIVKAAKNKEIHIFCIDKPPGLYYIYKYKLENEFLVTKPLYYGSFHRAVIKGNIEVLTLVNHGFDVLSKNALEEIDEKWLGEKLQNSNYKQYLLIIGIPLLLIIINLIIVNLFLRKKVADKTYKLNSALSSVKESEIKYKELFESGVESIFISAMNGQILEVNLKSQQLTEYSQKDLVTMNLRDLFIIEDIENVDIKYDLFSYDNNINSTKERKLKTKNGQVIHVEMNSKVLADNRIQTIMRDITDRKKSEIEIQRLNSELEKKVEERTMQLFETLNKLNLENNRRKIAQDELAKTLEELEISLSKEKDINELKSRFIGTVSHEFRTPLTGILNSTYIIEKYIENYDISSIKDYTGKIQKQVNKLTSLINDVLTLSKTEFEIKRYVPEIIDIIKIANHIIEEFKLSENSKFNFEYIHNNDSIVVNLNSRLFDLIFRNLLSNAIKYSYPNSTIKITISDIGNSLMIEIYNSGIGIADFDFENIFRPFYRSVNVGQIEGTGLGLSITKTSVDTIGGLIEVRSELNKYANFIVHLPKEQKMS